MFSSLLKFFILAAAASTVMGETHTITMNNHCGRGTPTLVLGGQVVSTGQPFTKDGPIVNAIAYLQTGQCGLNGANCATVEITLKNPTPGQPGSGSNVDISLIPPHTFNTPISFHYTNGCTNGASCNTAACPAAFHKPNDSSGAMVVCQANDVNLVIDFC